MLPGVDGGAGIVGRMVCREFDSGSSVVGTIAYAHRPDGDMLLYRVEYQDGDSEDLPEDEAFSILLPLPLQSATTAPSSTKVPAVEFQAIVAGAAAPAAALSTIGGAGAVGGGSGAPGADELDFLPTPARSVKKQKKKKRRKGGSNADDGRVEQEPAAAAAVAMAVAAGSGGGRSGPSSQKKGKHVGAGRVEDKMGVVGRCVWKLFGDEVYRGKVTFSHVLVSGAAPVYHVVYEDGDEEDMEYAEVRKLLNAGNLERTAEATAGVDQTIFHPPPPQTPHNNRNPAMLQGSLSASSTGGRARGGARADEDTGAYVDNNPEAAVAKFDDFMNSVLMAFDARAMERRKSKQFDGTDLELDQVQQQQQRQQYNDDDDDGVDNANSFGGESAAATPSSHGLLRREVARAYKEVASAGEAVCKAGVDELGTLLRLMEAEVRLGLSLDIFPLAGACMDGARMGRWGQEGPEAIATLETSLEASLVCLMIATSPGLDRRLLSDELVDSCLGLFRHHLARHVTPALDPSLAAALARGEDTNQDTAPQRSGGKGRGKAKGGSSGRKSVSSAGGDGEDGEENEQGGAIDARLEERLREVSKKICAGLGKMYEAMGLLDLLVSRVRLEDRVLLPLCSACKSCLLLEASAPSDKRGAGTSRLQPLQHGALGMLQSVTRRYPGHRTLVVEDVFGLLLKMPTGRRQLRTFRLGHVPEALGGANGGTDGYIQNITALIMLLVQSCVTSPPILPNAPLATTGDPRRGGSNAGVSSSPAPARGPDDGAGGRNRRRSIEQQAVQAAGVNPAKGAATFFASRFLSRCSSKEEGANFQPLLGNVVDDLLAAVLLPEWPAAELLLHALCRALIKDLKDHKGSGGRDQQYLLMAMDVLGKVAGGLADITRRERFSPMVLPKAAEAKQGGLPGDEGERVGCVCGRTPVGSQGEGLMLDCDRCHRWFHGPCVGINSQEECPAEWFCVDCTLLLQVSKQKQAYTKRTRTRPTAVNLSTDLLHSGAEDHDREANGGVNAGGGPEHSGEALEVSDLDVFRQLVLNRLTAVTGGGVERGQVASSLVGAGRSLSSSSSRSSRGGGVGRRYGERGWGWQARQTQLALWVEEAGKGRYNDGGGPEGKGAAAHLLGQWEPVGLSKDSLMLAHDGTLRLCRRLLVERELCSRGLDAILGHLLALLGDAATSLRARAVKRLGGIVDADASIMGREQVRQSVTSSFLDEAVSVRQAAVDLVGRYILAENVTGGGGGDETAAGTTADADGNVVVRCRGEPERAGAALLEKYFPALMDRLRDKGVSVRKSVVRILRGVLLWRSPHSLHTQICRALVYRAALVREEDTIRDLIRDTFQEIWFSEDGVDATAQSAVATPVRASRSSGYGRGGLEASPEGEVAVEIDQEYGGIHAVAVQLMEVVFGVKDNSWLVKLLRGMIFGPGSGDKQKKDRSKKREASVRRCQALVEAIVAIQLGLDDGISAIPEGTNSALKDLPKQLLACVGTLSVMCKASPALLAPHVETLLPYLKGENGLANAEESAVCQQVSDMVYETLPLLERPDRAQMTELTQDLVGLAYRFGSAVVHSSLRCLARLVQLVTHDATPLLDLLQSFYSRLHCYRHDIRQAGRVDNQARHHILRGLVVSGSICRFYAFGDEAGNDALAGVEDLFPDEGGGDGGGRRGGGGGGRSSAVMEPPKRVTENGARVEVFAILRLYLTTARDPQIRSKALQGLGQLLIGAPRLMLLADKWGVVGGALDPSAGDAVLAQALRCWKEILSAEEERVETGLAIDDMEATGVTVAQRVQGDQDAESSVVGGVLQTHLHVILSHLFHRNMVVRRDAISLLGVMLRQGLVNPVDVVPQLLALGGDSGQFVRSEAFRLLTVEDSKNSEFVRTRLLDGLFMAYTFQQLVLSDWRPLLPSHDPASGGRGGCSLVGPAYTMCVRPQRQSRYACLKHLLSLFAESKSREVRSLVQFSRQRVDAAHAGGEAGAGEANGNAQSPVPYKNGAGRASRTGSLGSTKDTLRTLEPLDVRALSFVCCTLAGLPYEVQEEPLFIVDYINRQMSLHGSQCLELLHTLFTRNGVQTPPPDSEEMDDDCDEEIGKGERSSTTSSGTTVHADVATNQEDGIAQLRRTCSVAAAFSMLLRLKRFLKAAYGLTLSRCQSYTPKDSTKATEKQAQRPVPPPEAFSPFSSRKAGDRSAFDPAKLGAAAEKAAETLTAGSLQKLANFYLELRSLAHDDPEDYSAWGTVTAAAGLADGGGMNSSRRGRKRSHGDVEFHASEDGEEGDRGLDGEGGGEEKRRRASTGETRATSTARRGNGCGSIGGGNKGKAKKAKTKRRRSAGAVILSDSSDGDVDEGYDEA